MIDNPGERRERLENSLIVTDLEEERRKLRAQVAELQGELKHSRSVAQSWFEKAGRRKGELEEARKSLVVFKEHSKEINDRLDKMGVGGNFWLIASRLDDVGDKLDELKEAQERGDEMAESIQLLKDSVATRGQRIAELERKRGEEIQQAYRDEWRDKMMQVHE